MFIKEIQAISIHHQKGMSHLLQNRHCGSQPDGKELQSPSVLLKDGEEGLKNLIDFVVRVLYRYLSLPRTTMIMSGNGAL